MYIKGNLESKKLTLRLILSTRKSEALTFGCGMLLSDHFLCIFFIKSEIYFYPGFSLFAIHWPGGVPG